MPGGAGWKKPEGAGQKKTNEVSIEQQLPRVGVERGVKPERRSRP